MQAVSDAVAFESMKSKSESEQVSSYMTNFSFMLDVNVFIISKRSQSYVLKLYYVLFWLP